MKSEMLIMVFLLLRLYEIGLTTNSCFLSRHDNRNLYRMITMILIIANCCYTQKY